MDEQKKDDFPKKKRIEKKNLTFTTLPLDCLTSVFQFLDILEKFFIKDTCRFFFKAFNSPSSHYSISILNYGIQKKVGRKIGVALQIGSNSIEKVIIGRSLSDWKQLNLLKKNFPSKVNKIVFPKVIGTSSRGREIYSYVCAGESNDNLHDFLDFVSKNKKQKKLKILGCLAYSLSCINLIVNLNECLTSLYLCDYFHKNAKPRRLAKVEYVGSNSKKDDEDVDVSVAKIKEFVDKEKEFYFPNLFSLGLHFQKKTVKNFNESLLWNFLKKMNVPIVKDFKISFLGRRNLFEDTKLIFSSLRNLKWLGGIEKLKMSFDGLRNVDSSSNDFLEKFFEQFRSLKTIVFDKNEIVKYMKSQFNSIQELHCLQRRFSLVHCIQFNNIKVLKSVSSSYGRSFCDGIKCLEKYFNKLEELHIQTDDVNILKKVKNLKVLNIAVELSSLRVSPENQSNGYKKFSFSEMPMLEKLTIYHCTPISFIVKLPKLKTLSINARSSMEVKSKEKISILDVSILIDCPNLVSFFSKNVRVGSIKLISKKLRKFVMAKTIFKSCDIRDTPLLRTIILNICRFDMLIVSSSCVLQDLKIFNCEGMVEFKGSTNLDHFFIKGEGSFVCFSKSFPPYNLKRIFGPISEKFLKKFTDNRNHIEIIKSIEYLELDMFPFYIEKLLNYLNSNYPSLKKVNSTYIQRGKLVYFSEKHIKKFLKDNV